MPVDAVRRNADGSRLHLLLQALQQSSSTEQEQQAPASSPPPPPPPPPRCVGRKRAWDGTAFGPWETLVGPPAGSKGPGKCPSVMINLNRGGRIFFWPGLVDEARRKILHEAVQNCIYIEQAAQMRELWGEDPKAHRYHGLCMRCQPISTFPELDDLKRDLEYRYGEEFNIGVDVLVYRDGWDWHDWRSDNTQGALLSRPGLWFLAA
eukprot:TRINITY_DN4336_c4_g1_i1.p1 TRINITY_DN4336_c4_g1~~TRINITY_DN4336_c4_g1_i1.p1  ORF type:complete len:207 (-),score=15.36 TRINITY_DN4336_c4_g1_i1:292-912(-)